jgi:GNAT superfamily N-acetyltransferase
MQTTTQIRRATIHDAGALARIAAALTEAQSVGIIRDHLARIVDRADHLLLVATREPGDPVGWIHASLNAELIAGRVVTIVGVAVAETHQGTGIGRKLVEATEQWTRMQGVQTLRVRCRSERGGAHAFYRQLGYERVKTQEVYRKTLSASRLHA